MEIDHILFKRSSGVTEGVPTSPNVSNMEYGELAVNYAVSGETIFLKNSQGDAIKFSNDDLVKEWIDENAFTPEMEETIAEALADMKTQTMNAESMALSANTMLGSGFTSETVTHAIAYHEETEAAALTNLNSQIADLSSRLTQFSSLIDRFNALNTSVNNALSGFQTQIDAINEKLGNGFENETVTHAIAYHEETEAAALASLDQRVTALENNS